MRRRRFILLVGIPLYVIGLVVVGTALVGLFMDPPFIERGLLEWIVELADVLTDTDYLLPATIGAVAIAATQVVFLIPVHRLAPPQGQRSKSLVSSLMLGAIVAAVMTTGLLMGLTELVASVVTGRFAENPWPNEVEFLDNWWVVVMVVAAMLASWGFWTAALLIFSRQLWADRALGRLVGLLLGGTIMELIVIIPIDLMVRRRTDCYCATGTFWSLCVAATGLMWLAGPGIFIAATSRRRRLWRRDWCGQCGQAKGPSPGAHCPECGFEWGGVAAAKPATKAGKGD